MLDGPFALALAAGMAATVNPCGFALLPAYLAAFVGDDHHPGAAAVPRAFAVSAAMTAGFVVVFGMFSLVITPLALSVERYLPWATVVIGLALVVLGARLLAGRELSLRLPKLSKGGRDGNVGSMFLFGVSYAVASLSCTIGPFLAVTSTTFRSGDVVSGLGVFITYGLGMGAVTTALTVGVALARNGLVGRLRRSMRYMSRISGALLVLAGAYVTWYGWFEIRLLNGGTGSDAVVDRALGVQTWLQTTVIPDDPVTTVGVIVAVLAVVAVVALHRSRAAAPTPTATTRATRRQSTSRLIPHPARRTLAALVVPAGRRGDPAAPRRPGVSAVPVWLPGRRSRRRTARPPSARPSTTSGRCARSGPTGR